MNSFVHRALTVSVAGACLLAAGTFTVPPAVAAIHQAQLDAVPVAAAAIEEAQLDSVGQSFELASTWTTAVEVLEPERDSFGVTEYSLVQWPVGASTPISSYFGYRQCAGCSTNHSGIDFTPGAGAPIEAVADGVVVGSTTTDGSWGVHTTIEHVIDGVVYRTSYAHMVTGSLTVSPGDTVQRGQVIGRVGNTGQSMGAHLHFTVQTASNTFINPLPWLQQHVNVAD